MNRRAFKTFLWVHTGLLAVILLFPLYTWLMERLPAYFRGCFLHDRLFLYCPMCGGTRAIEELLHFRLIRALSCNPYVMGSLFLLIGFDIAAFVRLGRGRERIYEIPSWLWIVMAVCLVIWGILRNYLMIAHGYDPLGDLGDFWSEQRFVTS